MQQCLSTRTPMGNCVRRLCLVGYVFSGVVVDLSDVAACDELGWRAIREADEYLRSRAAV